jgi:hypothetical protein
MDKRHARNLSVICLVIGIALVLWIVMSNSSNPSRGTLSISGLKDVVRSIAGAPRIDSSTQAVLAAQAVLDPRVTNSGPQVLDVRLITYRYAITRLNGVSVEGIGGVTAEMPVWIVIFNTRLVEVSPQGTNPASSLEECTYVLVDPQKGVAIQSGLLRGCSW